MKPKRVLQGVAHVGAGIAASVLLYMALHDGENVRFGKKRLDRITNYAMECSEKMENNGRQFTEYRNRADRCGVDFQLKQDFMRALMKGLRFSGKAEMLGAEAGIDAAYTLIFLALHDKYGYGAGRIQPLQEKIKEYAWMIRNDELDILEFMKCLQVECGQEYASLERYEAQYGELKIYG